MSYFLVALLLAFGGGWFVGSENYVSRMIAMFMAYSSGVLIGIGI